MLRMFGKILIMFFVLTAMASSTKAQLVEDGLISYWSFDEDTIEGEIVKDLWGNNHGTMVNNPEAVKGKYGQALEFSGANHVDVPDSESLDIATGEVSVTVWVNISGPSPTERGGIVEKGNGGITNTPLLLREWTGGTVDFEVRNADTDPKWPKLQSDSVVPAGQWTFLAGTYDGKEEKIYINSTLDVSMEYVDGFGTNDELLRIGWDPYAEERHFYGIIDEICVYNRALTPNEIQRNQDAALGLAIEPAGKLSSAWGEIKAQKTR
ncbi:LamG domain-containing protein [Candidatus Poribacteria bacterium]